MMEYSLEELLPIVSELTEKYTSKESTSITYEKANQLMEAVIYCIKELQSGNNAHITENEIDALEKLPARQAYNTGLYRVIEKVKEAQEQYNITTNIFDDYGNRNLQDTFVKGITGFFLYYDPYYAPQNTILTMDYPTLNQDASLSGIDTIYKYVNAIAMEQQFLHEIQKSHVYRVLQEYRNDYKESFINISQVILRHIIGNMLLQKIGTYNKENAYEALFHYIWNRDIDELEQEINLCLQVLMKQQCNEQNTLSQGKFYQYFQNDVHGFTLQLKTINEIKNMRNVVIL